MNLTAFVVLVANNDMEKVTISEISSDLYQVDFTNTKLRGVFNMKKLGDLYEVAISGTVLNVTLAFN